MCAAPGSVTVIKGIEVPNGDCDGIMYDELNDRIMLTNHGRPIGALVAIDPDSGNIVGTVLLEDNAGAHRRENRTWPAEHSRCHRPDPCSIGESDSRGARFALRPRQPMTAPNMKGNAMKSLLVAIAITLFASTAAFAANPSCEAQAGEKKLAGAAKSSFIKKCDKDAAEAATTACTTQATEKKLAGAAKSSFVKKCVKDTTTAAK